METTGSEESLAHHGKGPTDHSPLNLELLKVTTIPFLSILCDILMPTIYCLIDPRNGTDCRAC